MRRPAARDGSVGCTSMAYGFGPPGGVLELGDRNAFGVQADGDRCNGFVLCSFLVAGMIAIDASQQSAAVYSDGGRCYQVVVIPRRTGAGRKYSRITRRSSTREPLSLRH
jgi:hypothetical protein